MNPWINLLCFLQGKLKVRFILNKLVLYLGVGDLTSSPSGVDSIVGISQIYISCPDFPLTEPPDLYIQQPVDISIWFSSYINPILTT